MLAARIGDSGIYVLATAERLPFADAAFELVTIASAIHWFGREAIGELRRVLGANGWIVVCDVLFRAEMAGLDEFTEWMRSEGSVRYPPVARHDHSSSTVTAADLRKPGKPIFDAKSR
jgi:ubiquinone/menaquinone biosynthesis C-methylase UbiE